MRDTAEPHQRWARAPAVTFAEAHGGPVVVLRSGDAEALVAIQGAQVLAWRPAGHDDVLWLSPVAKLGTGKAVRGGIPVCWPWFGPHPTKADAPAHGVVRAAPWRIEETAATDGAASITFTATAPLTEAWPHICQARLTVEMRATLAVTLETVNTGAQPLTITEALHTYLMVGDIADVTVRGLQGVAYIDQLVGGVITRETEPLKIDREVDRIYQDQTGDVVVEDRRLMRRIRVAKSASLATVVWNPWIEKAARLGDIGADGHRRMVCIETANAGAHIVTVAPNARHVMRVEFSVERLP